MNHKDRLQYSKLKQDSSSDVSEPFLSDSEGVQPLTKRRNNALKWCIQASVFIVSLVFAALAGGAWVNYRWVNNSDAICVRKTTQYSPILNDVDVHYHPKAFNGSLLKETIYRRGPSPEVDAAWEALGVNYRSVVVPLSEGPKSGLAPDLVKINPRHGGGFPVQIEGLHQLHCLNLVRQGLYYNFKYYHDLKQGAFKNDDHILKLHITHCLDILRQQLMCTVDTAIFGQVWVDQKAPFAYVDFNAKDHVCKNFEDIRQWAEARQIPEDVPPDFLQGPQEGDTVYPAIP